MENLRAIMIDSDPHFASLHPIAQEMNLWPSIHGTEGSLNEYRGLGTQADYFLDKYGNGGSHTSGESSTGTSARRVQQAEPAQQANINAQIATQVEAAVRAQTQDIVAQVQRNVQDQINIPVNQNLPDITTEVSRIVAAQMQDMRDQIITDMHTIMIDYARKLYGPAPGPSRRDP